MSFQVVYDSPIGGLLLRSEDGLELDSISLTDRSPSEAGDFEVFKKGYKWLDRYFAGDNPGEPPLLRLSGSEFSVRVWRELMTVPYGRTVTYGKLAVRVGCSSAQAVGNAVGRNQLLIMIPCHRVVASNGPGGFSAGLPVKLKLLEIESRLR